MDDNDVTPSTLNEFDEQERTMRLRHDEPTPPQDDDVILQQALRARHQQNNDLNADVIIAEEVDQSAAAAANPETVQLDEAASTRSSVAPAIPPKPAHLKSGETNLNIPAVATTNGGPTLQDAFENKGFEVQATEI